MDKIKQNTYIGEKYMNIVRIFFIPLRISLLRFSVVKVKLNRNLVTATTAALKPQ